MGLIIPTFTEKWHTTSYDAINPSRPELSAAGKSIVITGAGQGIGAAAARSFAQAGAAHIALFGRTNSTLDKKAAELEAVFPNTKFHVYTADVTDATSVERGFSGFVAAVGGKIDVLVANASYLPDQVAIKDANPDQWIKDVEVNLKGPIILFQKFLKYGKEDGLIINVTSASSFLATPSPAAYSVGKEAALRFFQLAGQQHPALKIINIHPGVVDTDMNRKSGVPAMDDESLPADTFVWAASSEAKFLNGKYIFANFDVEEIMARETEIKEKKLLEMYLLGLQVV